MSTSNSFTNNDNNYAHYSFITINQLIIPMKKIFLILSAIPFLFFSSCQNPSVGIGGHDHEDEHAHQEETSVSLNNEQIKAAQIKFGKVEQKNLTDILKVTGELKVPNQNKANVTTLYPGVIKEIYVQPGTFVKKGQRIASVVNPDYVQLQEEYLNLTNQSNLAESEYQRQKELYEGKAGALKNFQKAEAEFKSIRTRKSSIGQQLQMMGINPSQLNNGTLITHLTVTAPVSGTLSTILVQIGTFVDTSVPIAEIVDNRELHVDLHVYEKDMGLFKVGQELEFTLTNNPKEPHYAKIYSTGSTFENDSKTILVHAKVVCDKTNMIDGMNISANVSLSSATVAAVPNEAIATHEGQDYIFVVKPEAPHVHTDEPHDHHDEGTSFERIPVILGISNSGYTQITGLDNIPANAKIVTKGAFFILAKMTNSGEGHSH